MGYMCDCSGQSKHSSVCVIQLDGLTHPTKNSRIRWTIEILRHSRKTRISIASNQENQIGCKRTFSPVITSRLVEIVLRII